MSEPFLSEIRIMSFGFAPRGWATCDGQLLPINQNQALFSLLGTTYGGNGQTNFALPNLQGRVPIHEGAGRNLGESAGEVSHTLTVAELPAHTHTPQASGSNVNTGTPANNTWAPKSGTSLFSSAPNASMNAGAMGSNGGSQPHANMSPFLVLNFCIALQGIFPSPN